MRSLPHPPTPPSSPTPLRTHSPWQRPLPPSGCDVAVVGGGVMGAATAWALQRLDAGLRVALLEAETLAFGASGRNAGFLLLGSHTDYARAVDTLGRDRARRLWRFTEENVGLVRELGGDAFDLALTGALLVAGDEAESARLRRSAALLEEDGVAATFLEADAANAALHAEGFAGALAVPNGGTLHPAKLVRHLARAGRAAVLEECRVTALEPAKGSVRLVSEGGNLVAPRVVLCLNAFLPHLVPALGAFVRPVRAQMLATAPVAPVLNRPVYSHEGFFYVRQMPDGRLLVGGARHLHLDDEVGYDDATTGPLQANIEGYLRRHFPAAAEARVERRWSGTMGFSPDGLPVVGAVPGVDGALFACGFTGHGMAYSVRFGLLLARLALGQDDEAADLFDVARFAATQR